MNDLVSTLLRLPIAMAHIGAEQLLQLLNPERAGCNSGRTSHDSRTHQDDFEKSASDLFSTIADAGQKMLRGMGGGWDEQSDREPFAYPQHDFASGLADYDTPTPTVNRQNRPSASGYTSALAPQPKPVERTAPTVSPTDLGRLDVSTLVVIGEGMAAGMGSFALTAEFQQMSFPAQLAQHLGSVLKQPRFESPGLDCSVLGESSSLRFPDLNQTTVFQDYPPENFGNLSVPGFKIRDCLRLRTKQPLIQQDDIKQTLANLILDAHGLAFDGESKSCTQLEAAIGRCPSTVFLVLGFNDVLEPSLHGDTADLPPIAEQRRDFVNILKTLEQAKADVVVLNVPDPLDTACFSSIESAARVLKTSTSALQRLYQLEVGDYLTVAGLLEIGAQINRGARKKLIAKHVLRAHVAKQISHYTHSLNEAIKEAMQDRHNVYLCDLFQSIRALAERGAVVSGRQFTADYLGGLYSLNGYSPGPLGQRLIANELIRTLNDNFEASIPLLELDAVAKSDPVASYEIASNRNWQDDEIDALPYAVIREEDGAGRSAGGTARKVLTGELLDRHYNAIHREAPKKPLELPLGLEQVLPLNKLASHHGDAMRVINCPRAEDVQFGACSNNVFDGLAMFGGHLEGSLRFNFSAPKNNVSHFEVSIEGPLTSEDGVLSTPDFLRFPLKAPQVVQPHGTTCSGEVDLISGQVSNLDFSFIFENSGLTALQQLNPHSFPSPAVIRFKSAIAPQEQGRIYGTAWARFQQRADGKLDFLFHGTAFVPMGPGFRFAIPLGGPDGDFANVPANGTQLHPHLHLSTEESGKFGRPSGKEIIPTNAIYEFTADASRTCFGDDFHLNHPELGFARGRSYLAGRIQIQFGARFCDSVPFAVSMLPPGGLTQRRNLSPLQDVFPGRLGPGMEGHDTTLRFPLRTYRQNDLYLIDDPFDIAIGAVNIYSGEVIGDFLHRALLGQALFYSLVRVEPRTPQGSFEYRGPAVFERNQNGQLRYRFNGTVYVLYEEGFLFPLPDLANGVPIGPDSQLDPYFQIDAVAEAKPRRGRKSGGSRMQASNSGDRFSYQYSISNHSHEKSYFEYTNHSQNGVFRMRSLTWVSFTHSKREGSDEFDMVTFSGLGTWSLDKKDRLHIASVQVSTFPNRPYISILIDGGRVSNINTRPSNETPPLTALEEIPNPQ